MKQKSLTNLMLILSAMIFFSCGGSTESTESTEQTQTSVSNTNAPASNKGQAFIDNKGSDKNVLQVAMGSKDFTTLVTAVKAAQVENALVNVGPLTVFAPTNEAFAKLPKGTVENLLKPENKAKLAFILINHVAPSNYPLNTLTKDAKKGRKLFMASGKYLNVENKDGEIYVGGTKILKSIKVSNGWIHVIGDVLVPTDDK